jgi:hypothetical protein
LQQHTQSLLRKQTVGTQPVSLQEVERNFHGSVNLHINGMQSLQVEQEEAVVRSVLGRWLFPVRTTLQQHILILLRKQMVGTQRNIKLARTPL